jgi:cytoplasmic iron level regulating protein YaaA (DUF328/UPF0246 family)
MSPINKILVPCTSRKSDAQGEKSSLADLSFNQLNNVREFIEDTYRNIHYDIISDRSRNIHRHDNNSRTLDWDNCLPAYKRYTGILFSKVEEQNWQNADNVLLVSPLWGIIKPHDKIPKYTLEMTDFLSSETHNFNSAIWRIWRPVLDELINELSDGQTTFSLLYNKCSHGFSVDTRNSFESPVIQWRDKYGHHKGEWLNDYLSNL